MSSPLLRNHSGRIPDLPAGRQASLNHTIITMTPETILLLAKAPRPGSVKSRLALHLGDDRAAELYRAFGLDVAAAIRASGIACTVCYSPRDAAQEVTLWLGDDFRYLPQEGDDLGARMAHAFTRAFSEGTGRAILIGSDIPELTGNTLALALRSLDEHDAVIGPARDGGYYLIGFRRAGYDRGIFSDIAWGSSAVFTSTVEAFHRTGRRLSVLPPLSDIDTADDLESFRGRNAMKPAGSETMSALARCAVVPERSGKPAVSVIIPVFGEAGTINRTLTGLFDGPSSESMEVIVIDGDPEGSTLSAIRNSSVVTTVAARGRARQMNAGAALSSGKTLVFLHADTVLPGHWQEMVETALRESALVGGAFDLAIDSERFSLKIIAAAASLRSRITRIPYGDQAIFIRKDYFQEIGGFRELPLMEDVDLMRRIKQQRDRITILPAKALTSSRRWEKEGALFCTLRNWLLITLYFMGVSPERLARFYR